MPKVTYISIPEEILQQTAPVKKVTTYVKHNFDWRTLGSNLYVLFASLLHRDNIMCSILSYLLGRVAIMGEMSPFGMALFVAVAQIQKKRTLSVGLWSLAGILSNGYYVEAGGYFVAMLTYALWSEKLNRFERRLVNLPIVAFFSVLLVETVMILFRQAGLYNIMLVIIEAGVCMAAAYIFSYGLPLLLQQQEKDDQVYLSSEKLVCLVVLLAIAVAGIGDVKLWDYSLRNIIGSLLVMMFALRGGNGLGASVGVAIGLVTGLTAGMIPITVSLYAVSGLVAGVFSEFGKYAVILGFILGSTMTTVYLDDGQLMTVALTETALASALFILVPVKKVNSIMENLYVAKSDTPSDQIYDEAVSKIKNIANMFSDLSDAFSSITAGSRCKLQEKEYTQALTAVNDKVCKMCSKEHDCWDKDLYRTWHAGLELLGKAELGAVTVANLPEYIRINCIDKQQFAAAVNEVFDRRKLINHWQKKLFDHRQMVTEQLKATSTIINNLGEEINKKPMCDTQLAARLKQKAALINCQLSDVKITGMQGSTSIRIQKKPCNGTRECANTVLPLAAAVMQEKLVLHAQCGSIASKQKCRLVMQVASRLSVVTGMAGAAKEATGVSGDSCAVVPLNKGKIALMISDGMGSGAKAAGESSMAVGFLERLLSVGFDIDVAVKTVNSLLLLRTPDETFATIDMAIIDTYSGDVEFLKVGSAPSYVKRVREVGIVRASSLPIGIMQQIEIEPIKASVVAEDLIVMVSDGIIEAHRGPDKHNWLANYLRRTNITDPQELADKILKQAIELSNGKLRDDLTVLVAKVSERSA